MPFDRLICKMDEIAGRIDEEVIMQIGQSQYIPVHAKYFRLMENDKIKKLNRDARVVVSHAGIGSILTALEQHTPVLILPRLKMLGEAWDDHQLEIAAAIASNENVRVVYDVNDLEKHLKVNYCYVPRGGRHALIDSIKEYLSSI